MAQAHALAVASDAAGHVWLTGTFANALQLGDQYWALDEHQSLFLARLDGGCQVPMGCHATLAGGELHVRGVIADPAGRPIFSGSRVGEPADAAAIGRELAELLLRLGADRVLDALAHAVPA